MSAERVVDNPFPGLRPFLEDEELLFFGREAQVDAMVDTLAATRFLAVIGTSGSGKSSLVNCGLVPALHRGLLAGAGGGWRIARMRPGSRPLRELALGLCDPRALGGPPTGDSGFAPAELMESTLRMSRLGLVDVVRQARLPAGVSLLVIVDQFEELFRFRALASTAGSGSDKQAAADEAIAFVNLLLEAVRQRELPIAVALSMRSDFLGDCAQYPGLPEAINKGQYLVPRMTRDERRDAIAGPVGVRDASIDPVLLTRLVNDVGDNPDQLSILQHALNRTWNQWVRDGASGALLLQHYEKVGTMSKALNQHAEDVYGRLALGPQRATAQALFKAITDAVTDARGTRRPTRFDALRDITGADAAALTAVIDVFRDPSCAFLMPPAGTALRDDTPIDISHESLMRVWDRLRTWADEEAAAARVLRRTSETAALHLQGKAALLRQPDLQLVLDWRQQVQPRIAWAARYGGELDTTLKFIDDSQRADTDARRARLLRARLWAISGIALIVGLVVTVVYFQHLNGVANDNILAATKARGEADQLRVMAEKSQQETSQARAELAATLNVLRQQPGFDKIVAEAQLAAPDLRSRVEEAAQSGSRVYIHYADADQAGFAERLRLRLVKEGYSAPGIERVNDADAPTATELRYFRESDAGDAQAVRDLGVRLKFGRPMVKLVHGYEKTARPRQVELWLARPNDAELKRLMGQVTDPGRSAADQNAAARQLEDRYRASPDAIQAALVALSEGLVPSARYNVLYFLARTVPIAWDPPQAAKARTLIDTAKGPGQSTREELERLRKVLSDSANGY